MSSVVSITAFGKYHCRPLNITAAARRFCASPLVLASYCPCRLRFPDTRPRHPPTSQTEGVSRHTQRRARSRFSDTDRDHCACVLRVDQMIKIKSYVKM